MGYLVRNQSKECKQKKLTKPMEEKSKRKADAKQDLITVSSNKGEENE